MSELKVFDTKPIMIDVPVPIHTPRLIIRPPQKGDGKALTKAKEESWPELQKWMEWAYWGTIDEEQDEILCREQQAKFITREDLMLFAFDKDNPETLIASTGLHRMNWSVRSFEIGYWVNSAYTGKGYATEIATALAHYAFGALEAQRVIVCADTENDASIRVIEKCGFKKEATFKNDATRCNTIASTHQYVMFEPSALPALQVNWGQ